MKVVRIPWLLVACGLSGFAMFSMAAVAADNSISVEDAVKESRATGKPILALFGTET